MPSSATLQTPSSPQIHNLPLDYFYSATLAPFYSALDIRSGKWYASYWERRNVNGTVERKRATHCLGEKTTRSKYPPSDIEDECKQFMATVNATSQTMKPEHVLTIVDFVDSVY